MLPNFIFALFHSRDEEENIWNIYDFHSKPHSFDSIFQFSSDNPESRTMAKCNEIHSTTTLHCLALEKKWEWKWRVISVHVCVSLFAVEVELCTATREQFRCDDFNFAKIPYIPFRKWHDIEVQMKNRSLHGKRFCLFISVSTKYVKRKS